MIRAVVKSWRGTSLMDGAGVNLRRVFGINETSLLDPFLLLDDLRSENPQDYKAGFPWHPHRGIETITYILEGDVEHQDSMGNKGYIGKGDLQWMTAGSGIIHQEMPKGNGKGQMFGFQLWANLPASEKMMAPRYRDIKGADIPSLKLSSGVTIHIIAGEVSGIKGPAQDVVIQPEYLDIEIPMGKTFQHKTIPGHTTFAYVIDGAASFGMEKEEEYYDGTIALFGEGDEIMMSALKHSARVLLVSGKPIKEPIAWRGPIVMNTQEEIAQAFQDIHNNTFIK